MKDETIYAIFDSYVNGNVSWVKRKVKLMTKAEFITFLEYARSCGIMPYKLRHLVEK